MLTCPGVLDRLLQGEFPAARFAKRRKLLIPVLSSCWSYEIELSGCYLENHYRGVEQL